MGIGVFFFWLLLSVGAGLWADSRGRNGWGYGLLSMFISPLLTFIILALRSDLVVEEAKADYERRKHERELESVRAIAVSASGAAAVVTPPAARSVIDELGKLADLRDRGVLSEAEFQAEKQKLLAANA